MAISKRRQKRINRWTPNEVAENEPSPLVEFKTIAEALEAGHARETIKGNRPHYYVEG